MMLKLALNVSGNPWIPKALAIEAALLMSGLGWIVLAQLL